MDEAGAASSPQVLRRLNARRLLEQAWRREAFTATDAMAATGLTRSTVIGVCDELVRQGWLIELDDARAFGAYTKGRPARRYALRERAALVAAIDAGYDHVSATVADLRGTVLGRSAAAIPAAAPEDVERLADAGQRRELAAGVLHDALAAASAGEGDLLALTIAVPAPVDAMGASPAEDPFWSLTNPGYADEFAGTAPIVAIENDANLAAIAEASAPEGGGRDADSFIALIVGEGMGAGLMIDRRLVRGRRGGAGELRFLDHVEGVGSADGLALLARRWAVDAIRDGLPPESRLARLDPVRVTESDVASAAVAGDPAASAIVDRLAERLARICLVLGDLLDVERIVVSGSAATAMPVVIDRAAAILRESDDPAAPDLRSSRLGDECVPMGAIEHGLALLRDQALDLAPTTRGAA
ncbi:MULTISPECIES: ROK family protein [unclassified Agromyces]|uniref:ROK family protein n=1 Tax=unclassified Agromyces TaxID=2639701 RepID=UPI003014566A